VASHHKNRAMPYREPSRKLHPLVHQLRKRRYELGLGASDLAKRIGYELGTIQNWEMGNTKPTLYSLETWAEGLGMKLELKETL